ncbi:MAG TPA: transketolase family protein [Candidatus Copromorpha excrementigallinarum]|uniref:Transketolase family protein n=1 Tax=Candidatus Allocopromorpha excrementigallinarum TaxID=2840742 RepID=A0A9D1I113_9FIRM|nr:transketolase family protein [Candidatus Copromorpha excrementigallinarum]
MVKLLKEFRASHKEMRQAYCDALIEAAKKDERIAMVNCDLCSSMGLKPFAAEFPERSVNVGIEEANGCSMAGGMSVAGMIPFFNTFAVFATRRVYDQIFMSCAYPKLNVKIIGGDAGVSATNNGGTHMPFEDMGIMRVMPGVTVLEPSDPVMMTSLTKTLAETYGVQYMRFTRKKTLQIYEEGSEFEIGKAVTLREGKDAVVFACGLMVAEALEAADMLAKEGIEAAVIDMFTIKPVDRECIIRYAKETGAVVTAENHQVIGGLGSAVAEVLAENCQVPLERVGVKDEFGEVGPQDYLMERFKLTAPNIAEAVKKVIKKKKKQDWR